MNQRPTTVRASGGNTPTGRNTQLTRKSTDSIQTPPEECDVVVLGSGEAGKYLAWTLAKQGMRTVVIERKYKIRNF